MADTAYTALYDEIRTVCGDWGVIDRNDVVGDFVFRNDIIDKTIKTILLDISGYSDASGAAVTPEIANDDDRQLIIYATAYMLLLSLTEIAYQTQDERFIEKINKNQLREVAAKFSKLKGAGGLVGVKDGSLAAIVNRHSRMGDYISEIIE